MNDSEVARQLAELMTVILHETVDPNALTASLAQDYGANSMDTVDIIERIERRFGVKIANDELFSLVTFGDVLTLVLKRLPANAAKGTNGGDS